MFLDALDWLLRIAPLTNVRVANSPGNAAVTSYRMIVLLPSAALLLRSLSFRGSRNNGKNRAGQKVYGQVHSPGNEPSAITIGAADTKGTDNRADDGIASYSSRGPTRSYWVDVNGRKRYDNLVKPDLSAPGNKLIYAQSPNCLRT